MHDAGFQIATHSNGDREIDMVLTAIERAQAQNPRPDARHRIEHASVMNQSAARSRQKRDGVILVFHSYMWEHGDKLASYGEKRLAMIHPYRTGDRHGNPRRGPFRFHRFSGRSAAAHSGHGHAQRVRTESVYGGNQRVSVEEAIKVWTLDGAYATFEEKDERFDHAGQARRFRGAAQKIRARLRPMRLKISWSMPPMSAGARGVWHRRNATRDGRRPPPLGFFGDGDEVDDWLMIEP